MRKLTAEEQDGLEQMLALSGQLQMQFLSILNGGPWAQCPHTAAHACAELLGQVLRACVLTDPKDRQWALTMTDHVRQFVVDASPLPEPAPGAQTH